MQPNKSRSSTAYVASVIFILFILTFFMMPLLVMGYDSFHPNSALMVPYFDLQAEFTFRNYVAVFQNASFVSSVINSLIVALLVTAMTVICGATAAYSFTRFQVVGSRQISTSILVARMIPSVVMGIPLYIVGKNTGLLDTYFILIVAITTFALPFQIWMLLGFFAQIPRSLDESALIDGCSYFQAFIRIIAPSAAPGLSATAIMTFFFSWNELFFALILCGMKTKTAPMAVMDFLGYRNFDWGAILAAGMVLILPTLIIGIIFKRYMVSGLTAGAVKG